MSVSIHSPLPTYSVFPSFHDSSLSPPPTPLAKRARHFFPSNSEASSSPVPMFFPTSKSLLSHRSSSSSFHNSSSPRLSPTRLHDRTHAAPTSPTFEKENVARRQLKDMARRPPPALRLRPRPLHCSNKMLHTNSTKGEVDKARQVDMDRIPSLPLWSPCDSSDDDTPKSCKSVPTPTTTANPEKVEPKDKPSQVEGEVVILNKPQRILKKSTSAIDGRAKLPTFQRRGVRRVVTKRNSFAARSA